MKLLLVRHGQSSANAAGILQGALLNIGLTELGREQARNLAGKLAQKDLGAIRLESSDQLRALQTAAPIAKALQVPIDRTALLREQSLGALEGRPANELSALETPTGKHITEIAWGGGESIAVVYRRCERYLESVRVHECDTVITVSHGITIDVLHAAAQGLGHREVVWHSLENCGVLALALDGQETALIDFEV